ncbi:MAG: alanine--tRNA ligase-related protein, partial [Acidobacteriaceae bacterium]
MTTRLYHDDSGLLAFSSRVTDARENGGRTQIALAETAFYPTSGGQPFDTGILCFAGTEARVVDVLDDDAGMVWHVLETE